MSNDEEPLRLGPIPCGREPQLQQAGQIVARIDAAPALTTLDVTVDQLRQICSSHSSWLAGEPEGRRAEFDGRRLTSLGRLADADLSRASFRGADLTGIAIDNCNLSEACFDESVLDGAAISNCDLNGAQFRGASLRGASMSGVAGVSANAFAAADLTAAKLPDAVDQSSALGDAQQASGATRSLFLSLLLGCIYSTLTVAATTDEALLADQSAFPLPIVNTAVSIGPFYWFAPWILLAVYLCFLFSLDRWARIVIRLPAALPDGRQLDEFVEPWLFNSLIAIHVWRPSRRPASCNSWVAKVQAPISGALMWLMAPAAIGLPGWRFLGQHEWAMTLLHALVFVLALGSSACFYAQVTRSLRVGPIDVTVNHLAQSAWRTLIGALLGIVALAMLTPWGQVTVSDWYPRLDVSQRAISRRPNNWDSENPQHWRQVQGARLAQRGLERLAARESFLIRSDFSESRLYGSDFTDADVRLAKFRDANIQHGTFRFADAREALFSAADLTSANLMDANLERAICKQTKFIGADLTRVIFNDATLVSAQFERAALQHAKFVGADCTGANFTRATLHSAHFDRATLQSCELVGAEAPNAKFPNAILIGAKLMDADLSGADLSGADLRGADLSRAKIAGATFANADLRGATLGEVDRSAADFSGARFD